MRVVNNVLHRLWNGEIAELPEARWRRVADVWAFAFSVAYPISFVATLQNGPFLGPGLGEPSTWSTLRGVLPNATVDSLNALAAPMRALLYSVIASVAFRVFQSWRDYRLYRTRSGDRMPKLDILTWGLVNGINLVGIIGMLGTLGIIAMLFGGTFGTGLEAIDSMSAWANGQVMAHVPTVASLPVPLAVLSAHMLAGLVHYWLHRLGHTMRLPWLLFHRTHHMPSHMSQLTTVPVFFAVPLFVLAVVPYNFIFGATTKLFSSTPLYVEMIMLNTLISVPEIYSHSESLYQEGRRNWLIRLLAWASLNGPYHLLHHSAEPGDADHQQTSNLINLGGGLFGLWDAVFGTYRPLRAVAPRVGLTTAPQLRMNPLRLALAGMAQMAYELRHNAAWRDRIWVLLGPSSWNPPNTRDYALRTEPPTHTTHPSAGARSMQPTQVSASAA